MNLSSYLKKRPNSSKWQLRWMVPLAARPIVGRAEFTKSLGVTDRVEAEKLAYPILAAWRDRVANALASRTSFDGNKVLREATDAEVDAHHVFRFETMKGIMRSFTEDDVRLAGGDIAKIKKKLEKSRERLASLLFTGEVATYLKLTEGEMRDRGLIISSDPVKRDEHARKAVQVLIDSYRYVEAEIVDQGHNYEPSKFLVDVTNFQKQPSTETVMAMFDQYAAQRLSEGVKRRDGINQDRIVVERLADFIGRNKKISAVTRSDIRDWRNIIANLPKNYRNMKVYDGMSIGAVAAHASSNGIEGLSPTTQNKYLSTISPLFKWAIQHGFADNNPCDGLFLNIDKQARPHPTFTSFELNRIISSPLFTGCKGDGYEHQVGNIRVNDWRKWIPLLCFFTGSRIGEVAQLRLSDVRFEHERWFIHIRHDPTVGQQTKSNKGRIIPLHRTVEFAGFKQFYDNRQSLDGNDGMLFDGLVLNRRGHIGASPSRFWRNYLSKIGLKNGGDGKGSHSFRHTLADELRAAGYLDDQFGPLILGHNKTSVTAGYGRMPQGTAKMLCEMIDAVKFEGVNFDALYASKKG
ncbi:tyrosine-type recombinase/integrase [Sphingomonas sp. CFBP 8760]|uniref:tyrosine-type recombinase/integrase n=1 Tax=Sphingomonas sp. CFBP 8760 TaxID=2775282 RepID=UPI00177D6F82|nr:tyrosine-type recombinase/integrase [Sphingomonas sp. CFBP 8760]MBD8549021.1 tyrosine-type recombinase/integrase [Sphingomonas sp. CFBP 8760]